MLDRLAADGVFERLELAERTSGRFAFEVFPHPAHVRLFDRASIFRYKKKTRPWPTVLAAWAEYRAALGSLEHADPSLVLGIEIPHVVVSRGYKAWDDLLDGVTCAYVASYLWRWGTSLPRWRWSSPSCRRRPADPTGNRLRPCPPCVCRKNGRGQKGDQCERTCRLINDVHACR